MDTINICVYNREIIQFFLLNIYIYSSSNVSNKWVRLPSQTHPAHPNIGPVGPRKSKSSQG